MVEEKDITEQLLGEVLEAADKKKLAKKSEEKNIPKQVATPEKERKKSENIASETPQDRFRRIVKDQGYNIGLENMTSVFFEGNTDSPQWLDEVLKLSHIPSKNREIIITAYYGKTLKDLGITIEPAFSLGSTGGRKEDDKKTDDKKAEDEIDIIKMSQEELKETIKNEKTLLAIAQMRDMRERLNPEKKQEQHQQVQMRQVIRPLIRDGKVIYDAKGVAVTETVLEPVLPGNQGGVSNDIITMLLAKVLSPQASTTPSLDSSIVEYMKKIDMKIEKIDSDRQIQDKNNEIKRLQDKLELKEAEFKKDLERKENDFKEKLSQIDSQRIRDLEEIKERFTETIKHKEELDNAIGQISGSHKKEIDGLKQKLEHAQTNIERTIVSKSTDTVDKLTGKVGDIAESVIKPMADVMKDHYKTVIDQTRANAGLPSLRETVPKVAKDELEKFVSG